MNAIPMIERCAGHALNGMQPVLGIEPTHYYSLPHPAGECWKMRHQMTTSGPNLVVWNGARHALAFALKD